MDLLPFFAVMGAFALLGAILDWEHRRDERRWKRQREAEEAARRAAE